MTEPEPEAEAGGAPAPPGYRTLLRLASGGMGTVYLALRERGRDLVAIKVAHPHLLLHPGARRHFVEEARLAARIRHPNVVEVLDVLETAGTLTLVMPYVEGASLAGLIARCIERGLVIPPGVALRIVLDAAAGLTAAHETAGADGAPLALVHRDVSPDNLLLGIDGVTRVADFGIAKHRREDGYLTAEGKFKGKVAYAAPEAARGQTIDARFDVFSLGVVLWETLAMERLFAADNEIETLARVERHRPPSLSERHPALARLDPVIARALEKSKNARFSTMRAFGDELERVAGAEACSHRDVAAFLVEVLGGSLARRRALVDDRFPTEKAPIPVVRSRSRKAATIVGVSVGLGFGLLAVLELRPPSARTVEPAAEPEPLASPAVVAPPPSAETVPSAVEPPRAPAVVDSPPSATPQSSPAAPRQAARPSRPSAPGPRPPPPNPYR